MAIIYFLLVLFGYYKKPSKETNVDVEVLRNATHKIIQINNKNTLLDVGVILRNCVKENLSAISYWSVGKFYVLTDMNDNPKILILLRWNDSDVSQSR